MFSVGIVNFFRKRIMKNIFEELFLWLAFIKSRLFIKDTINPLEQFVEKRQFFS